MAEFYETELCEEQPCTSDSVADPMLPGPETNFDGANILEINEDKINTTTRPDSIEISDGNRCFCANRTTWNCPDKEFKRKVFKNVYVIGCVFSLLFTAVAALVNLQSSLFIDEGLGVVSQSINYVVLALSSLFLPKILISKMGHKWTLVTSLLGCVTWMAANGYATWVTMTLASMVVGISSGPMWAAFGAFLTILAERYSRRYGKDQAQTVSLFFGIGLGLLKSSRLFGSLLAWGVLQKSMYNASVATEDDLKYCGSADCPWLHTTNIHYQGPPDHILWTLVGICLIIGIASILVTIFLMDELPDEWCKVKGKQDVKPSSATLQSMLAASKLHRDIKQILVIPICLYMGLSVSFVQADFNKSFVTCTLGIWMVGLVLIPNAIFTVGAAFMSGRIGRGFFQFIFGFLVDAGVLVACLLWKPNPDNIVIFFILSGCFGVTGALWHTQVNALVGVMFKDKESAMANCMLWQSIGFAASFGMSKDVCVDIKIYTTMSMLVLGTLCLVILYVLRNKQTKTDTSSEKVNTGHDTEIL